MKKRIFPMILSAVIAVGTAAAMTGCSDDEKADRYKEKADSYREKASSAMECMALNIVEERAYIIDEYISDAEEALTLFSRQNAWKILENPDDPKITAEVQAQAETFMENNDRYEGIYISDQNTKVLAHSSPQAVGMITRDGDTLEPFLKILTDAHALVNKGMFASPATKKIIVNIQYPVFGSDDKLIGYSGTGLFVDNIIEDLNNIPVYGLSECEYYIVDVDDLTLCCNGNSLEYTETEDKDLMTAIKNVNDGNKIGTFKGEEKSVAYIKLESAKGTMTLVMKYKEDR